jgi:hypothetical protein
MPANVRRGIFRIWIVASVFWFLAIAVISLKDVPNVLTPQHSIVHVRMSDTEMWEYPSEMDVEAIRLISGPR